jgi:hypothetical protein
MLDSVGGSEQNRAVAALALENSIAAPHCSTALDNRIGQPHWITAFEKTVQRCYCLWLRARPRSVAESSEEGQRTKHQGKYTHNVKLVCPGTVR